MEGERLDCPAEPAAAVELRELVQRAQGGDAGVLPRLRAILDDCPEVWRHLGDLSALAERAWVAVLAGGHPLAAESMRRTVAEMKAELSGERPGRLEKMLVDEVLACWLETKYLEATAAEPGRASVQQAGHRLKRLESAQRRYLNAVKTLTAVRKLIPASAAPAGPIRLHREPERERA
jgi:hypothetical protein